MEPTLDSELAQDSIVFITFYNIKPLFEQFCLGKRSDLSILCFLFYCNENGHH